MATKNYSISLPIELAEWLDKNDYVSLSKLAQESLQNFRKVRIEATKDIEMLHKANEKLQEMLFKANQFITDKGLWGEFCKEGEK